MLLQIINANKKQRILRRVLSELLFSNKDIYKVQFVEAYFRENILMDSYSNPVVNIEMPFANPWQNGQFVSYPTEKEVNEAIEKYQNKLNKYEITFKIDNETYKFDEIKKI